MKQKVMKRIYNGIKDDGKVQRPVQVAHRPGADDLRVQDFCRCPGRASASAGTRGVGHCPGEESPYAGLRRQPDRGVP